VALPFRPREHRRAQVSVFLARFGVPVALVPSSSPSLLRYTEFASTGYTKIDGNPMPKDLKLFKGEHFVTIDASPTKTGERRTDL